MRKRVSGAIGYSYRHHHRQCDAGLRLQLADSRECGLAIERVVARFEQEQIHTGSHQCFGLLTVGTHIGCKKRFPSLG